MIFINRVCLGVGTKSIDVAIMGVRSKEEFMQKLKQYSNPNQMPWASVNQDSL